MCPIQLITWTTFQSFILLLLLLLLLLLIIIIIMMMVYQQHFHKKMAVHLLIKCKIYSIYSAKKKYIIKSGAETRVVKKTNQ